MGYSGLLLWATWLSRLLALVGGQGLEASCSFPVLLAQIHMSQIYLGMIVVILWPCVSSCGAMAAQDALAKLRLGP